MPDIDTPAESTAPAAPAPAPADDRDVLLAAGAADCAERRPHKPWTYADAAALLARAGRSESDEAYKNAKGMYPTCHGWPVTSHAGRRVCLNHAGPDHRWFAPDQLDNGR